MFTLALARNRNGAPLTAMARRESRDQRLGLWGAEAHKEAGEITDREWHATGDQRLAIRAISANGRNEGGPGRHLLLAALVDVAFLSLLLACGGGQGVRQSRQPGRPQRHERSSPRQGVKSMRVQERLLRENEWAARHRDHLRLAPPRSSCPGYPGITVGTSCLAHQCHHANASALRHPLDYVDAVCSSGGRAVSGRMPPRPAFSPSPQSNP